MVWKLINAKVALSDKHYRHWMDVVPVDVADRPQYIGDIWRPYAISSPTHQHWRHAWPPRRHPRAPGCVHSLPLASLAPKARPQQSCRRELTPASSSVLHAASPPTKDRPKLHCVLLSNFHPQARRETLRWVDISNLPQIGSPKPFSPASPMLSSSEPLIFSGWVLGVA